MRLQPLVALAPLALLAACNKQAPSNDSRSASGEVLEGTISDAMLPVDRVQSEPPLEDPEAFAKVRSKAAGEAGTDDAGTEAGEDEQPAPEVTQPPTPDVTPAE